MKTELKPCPKCGSNQVAIDYRWDSLNLAKTYFVYCRSCDIYFNGNYSEDSTIAKWNTRPAEDAKDKEIARLKAALHSVLQNAEFWDNEDDSLAIIHRIATDALGEDTEAPANASAEINT